MGVIRGYVVEHLAGQELVVAALDESGQAKQGTATAGVTVARSSGVPMRGP